VTTALLDTLTDQDDIVRAYAAQALAGRPGKQVTTALLAALNDDNHILRAAAAQALADRPDEQVTTALLAAVTDVSITIREAVAQALVDRPSTALLALSHRAASASPTEQLALCQAAELLLPAHYANLRSSARRAQVRAEFGRLTRAVSLESRQAPVPYGRAGRDEETG
jgi:HEAT repeat protein